MKKYNIGKQDCFDYVSDLAEDGIKIFLLEKSWNKSINVKHKNILKVKSWEEIIL